VRDHELNVENLQNQVEELTAEVASLKSKLEVSSNKYNSSMTLTVSEHERKFALLQEEMEATIASLEKELRE